MNQCGQAFGAVCSVGISVDNGAEAAAHLPVSASPIVD